MKLSRRSWLIPLFLLLGLVPLALISSDSALAQSEETELIPELENEWDTGFERSDLGNVAQTAKVEYAEGHRTLAQARKIRGRIAETADPDKKAKLEAKLQETYQSAAKSFTDAIGYAPKMSEAYAGLGETLREWGQLEQSLEVYAAAVRRFPDDLENFEGWAMTLMELNMLGNATSSYTSYVEANPDRAAILMEVMQDWLKRKQADPGDLNPADVDRLAAWIQQQDAG
jgi:tetratricopeptide (TPR) repeat protein